MRLIALSDSHGHVRDLRAALALAFERGNVDACVFLGDGIGDLEQVMPLLKAHNFRMEIRCVAGNNDFCFFNEPTRLVTELGGVKIYCAHGHLLGVRRGLQTLACEAQGLGARVALYGHTHEAKIEQVAGILTINPSAVCERRAGQAACAELIVKDNGTIHANLILWPN